MFVKDLMTSHPVTVTPAASIPEAERIMRENNIRHLPVVTSSGKLAGLLTRTTLHQVLPSKLTTLDVWEMHYQLEKIQVRDAMVKDVVTVGEDVPIEQAARMMLEKKIGCLVVMRDARVAGIITDIDLMRGMMGLLGARQPGCRVTLKVPDQEGELLKVTTAITAQHGYFSAMGTYPADEPLKWWVVMKVRFVEPDVLAATLRGIEGIELIDMRED